ncbi:MAG: hypothetical protein M0018_05075 [Nitrospiraceae bacterium]|nr:hypothetical protein [Nitrospiraceae bacterium]
MKKQRKSRLVFTLSSIFAFIIIAMIALAPMAQADNIQQIDIYAPGRPIPIAISPLAGLPGDEISSVVIQDLDATSVFTFLDPKGFSESPTEPFNQADWLPTQVVAVLKGTASISPEGDISATATLYDVQSGAVLFSKSYGASLGMLRSLAHDISSDVFKQLTGYAGPFKCKLSYISEKHGRKNIVIADWDAYHPKTLRFNERLLMPPKWGRDNKSLFYSAERGGAWGIYRLDIAHLKESLVFYRRGTSLIGDISPSGQILFSSSYQSSPNIYIINPEGNGGYGPPLKLTHTHGINVSPALSPDGRLIAYVSDRDGSPQIYVMNTDGSNITRVTFQGNYNTAPVWSPDGKRIAFAGRAGGGQNQIFTVKPDGSDLMQLTSYGNNEDPCFSPDGSMIAFSSDRNGVKSIYIMRSNGEGQRRIKTANGANAYGPRWSYN